MLNKKLCLALALASISFGVIASWQEVAAANDGQVKIYSDPASRRLDGNIVKMWILWDFKTLQKISGVLAYKSSIERREFNCTNETTRILSFTNYVGNMGGGKPQDSSNNSTEVMAVAPGTINEALWKAACDKE